MKTEDELQSWIALWRVSGVGSKSFQKLLSNIGDPDSLFSSNMSTLTQAGISEKLAHAILDAKKDQETAAPDIEWLNEADDHHIITIHCDEYPELLKRISDPPPLLYVHGQLSLLKDPQIAIVGSRNPTQGGTNNAYEFAKHLGQTGFCITSGLAMGVDGSAHTGALEVEAPTIAVIATGIDRVYPAKHREMAHKIADHGAIVTEFPIGTQPKSSNFPRRNRIISGLSYGTLVVEAAQQSGSLITARLAMEQNREVFAIPGSIHNPLARGCHKLIRQGAKLVETAQDIMEEMASVIDLNSLLSDQQISSNSANEKSTANKEAFEADSANSKLNTENQAIDSNQNTHTDDDQQIILKEMGFDPISIDQLAVRTGIDTASLSASLLMLELQNQIASNGGGTYTRLK
ncbi:DNA-processing protein DprA [Cocleimonas sp. KMM 6892]|uniref:DNA-processing protein DprA n=1 Tax=unclassified Cocleimonas TaxID=2639732 RepID=UPI002DB798A5|nr:MULTISPECIES: DNA-processing protein DprA [unclassified Cocleimonas]MEB8432567.1 DNA-processing protein DprA [Cocleimonas sp. KMM 6892]MEC4715426.1 DNA-processing protein DprA [Cocleimonas sp. KMM 6895]MEC4744955.1 DNA-processing protein DprA [Cocleimonas sp. KMM 6896]